MIANDSYDILYPHSQEYRYVKTTAVPPKLCSKLIISVEGSSSFNDFLRRWRDLQTMEHGSARIRLEIFLKNYIQASF